MAEIDLSLWRSRIEQAVALQTKQHARWREAQDMVEGRWGQQYGWLSDPDFTPVNYAKAYVAAVLASLYARNPYFFVKARTFKHNQFARSLELVLNYLREELNLKAVVKRCITQALITGIAWAEVGYTATFESLELETQDDPGLLQRLLSAFKRPSTQGVLNEYVKEVSAFTVGLSAWKVYLAPGYHSVNEMPYLIVAEDIAPEDLHAHPLYSRSFSLDGFRPTKLVETSAGPLSSPGIQRTFGAPQNGKQLLLARLYHVWDRRNAQRFIWLDGTTQVAGPYPWPYAFEGFSQVPLIFNELPETDRTANAYPLGDITFMIPQLKELCLLRTQMVKHRRRSGSLILAQETALTDEQATKMQRSDDVTLIKIKGNPSTDIVNHTPANLAPDVYRVGDRILADLDLISQIPFLLPTLAPGSDRTATEVQARSAGAGTIRGEKVDVIEDFMRQLARRLAAVAWEFYPRAKIQQILGEDQLPDELWPQLPDDLDERRKVIEEELEFSIEAGSTQPLKDKTLKNEQKIRLLNILGGIAPERIKITSEGLGQLVQDFEMPELAEWMILDDEEETQVIEQENQLLAQGIPQVVGPNENHELHEKGHALAMQQGASTPAADQHLLAHRQQRERKGLAKRAQQGDGGTRGAAAKPEAQRQGVTDLSDLLQVVGQATTQRGTEQGGNANLDRL